MYAGERPPDPAGYDLVVSLGSEHAAHDDSVPWQADEQATLRAAAAADVPVFGVCFGGQSLSRALGGEARPTARPELGWVSVGAQDGDVPDGPWFSWHVDQMVPPPGAEVLARNASGVQAWRLGRHVALQFHPEVSRDIAESWLSGSPEKVRALGADPAAVVEETRRRADEARERAFALFDALLGEPT
jgi:GMP synthase-like glutamine amidotransferase